jgi:hypothetical protein
VRTVTIVGGGKPIELSEEKIRGVVTGAHVLLLGLSSSTERARVEMVAAKIARAANIPFGFYSDMALCPFRPWLDDLAKDASFICGMLPEDVSSLGSMYPKAKYFNTGNPFRTDMAFPSITREAVREQLGIKLHEKLILAAGGKFATGNFQIWGLLLEELQNFEDREDVVVMLSPHPGDRTLHAIDKGSGKSLPLYSEMGEETAIRTLYAVMPTPVAVAGADLVVDFTGDTSIRSAYLRIPLVNITSELMLSRFEKETGSRAIETADNGSGVHFPTSFSEGNLLELVRSLLNPTTERAKGLREAQERAYPIPTDRKASLASLKKILKDVL